MKKMYFLLTFALLCCVNAAFAAVEQGDPKTTFANGDKVLITTTYNADGVLDNGKTRFLSNSWNKPTIVEIKVPTVSEVYQMVAVGEKFALKNIRGGFYLALPASLNTADHFATGDKTWSVGFKTTTDLAEATAFDVMSAAAAGEIMKYDASKNEGREPDTEDVSFLVTMTDEFGEEVTLALNNVGGAYMATYNDYATWYSVKEALEVENWVDDLGALLPEVMNEAFVDGDMDGLRAFVGGTAPGCRPAAVVNDFYEKFFAADTYYNEEMGEDDVILEAHYVALEAAWQAIIASEIQPMTAGKYRILNGTAGFLTRNFKAAIYATPDGGAWNKLDSLSTKYMWEITQVGQNAEGKKTWKIQNINTKQYFNTVEWNTRVTMSEEFVKPVYIEALDKGGQFNIIQTNGNANKYHAGNHGGGANNSGNLLIWDGGSYAASSWTFEPVTDADIEAADQVTKQAELNAKMQELIATAAEKLAIAKAYIPDMSTALITDVAQISTNADQNTTGTPDGGGIPALIDGDSLTFFHSSWQNGPSEAHYLQFELNEPIDAVSISLTRRFAQNPWNWNNFPSIVVISASNDGVNFTNMATANTVFTEENSTKNPTYTIPGVGLNGEYKHIRMTVTKQYANNNPFFTLGELQLHSCALDPECLYSSIPTAAPLDAAIAKALAIAVPTQADIDELQVAYDAYIAELPDPTALNAAITKATQFLEDLVEGTSPGMFPEGTDTSALEEEVAKAQALLEGEPTKAQIEAQVETLNAAYDALITLVNGIETNVWYYFRSASTARDNKVLGQYVMVSEETTSGSNTNINMYAEENASGSDYAKFRFIALGDTAYLIQNKGTGLYLTSGSGALRMSHMPSMFKTIDLGKTQFVLDGYRLDNAYQNPIHIETGNDVGHLVGWPAKDLNSSSAWNIINTEEEVIVDEVPATLSTEKMVMGLPVFRTFPLPVDITEMTEVSFYSICNTVAPNEDEPNGGIELISLDNEEGILPAGVPFIVLWGMPADFKEERTPEDTLAVTWIFTNVGNNEVPTSPVVAEDSLVIGTYYGGNAPKDATVLTYGEYDTYVTSDDPAADRDNDGWVTVEEGTVYGVNAHCLTAAWNPGWNTAYINTDKLKNLPVAEISGDGDGEVFIPFNRPISPVLTGIEVVEGKVNAANGDIYTTTGILVRKNSTSTVGLPKGLYIVNGKTVIVK